MGHERCEVRRCEGARMGRCHRWLATRTSTESRQGAAVRAGKGRDTRLTRYCAHVGEGGRAGEGERKVREVGEQHEDHPVRRDQERPFSVVVVVDVAVVVVVVVVVVMMMMMMQGGGQTTDAAGAPDMVMWDGSIGDWRWTMRDGRCARARMPR